MRSILFWQLQAPAPRDCKMASSLVRDVESCFNPIFGVCKNGISEGGIILRGPVDGNSGAFLFACCILREVCQNGL